MRVKGIWVLLALALAAIAFAAAGCGGSSSSSSTTTAEAAAEETTTASEDESMTEETTTEDTTEAMTTEETDTTAVETDTGASGDTSANLSFLSSAKCQEYVQLIQNYASALSGAGGSDMKSAADALQEVADKAPNDIKGDFQTLADAYSKIADALGDTDLSSGQTPSPEAIAKLQKLGTEIDQAKLTAASTNISTWLTQNCTGTGG